MAIWSNNLLSQLAERGGDSVALRKSWPEESPYREELALLPESDAMHLPGTVVRQTMRAGDENNWAEQLKSKASMREP